VDQALESRFLLDPEKTELEKRVRERQFHLVEVPRLRLLGMAILTTLVIFHELFSTGETNWRLPLRIGLALLVYALASWAILYRYFEKARPRLNLGTLFLALDIPAFVWVNDAFRQAHPEKVTAMQANAPKEIRSHDVFGTVADLMGISWPGANPVRSFASDKFVPDTAMRHCAGGQLVPRQPRPKLQ